MEKGHSQGNRSINRWNYKYTGNYGSPMFKVSAPDTKGTDPVEVTGVTLSADKKSVTLKLSALEVVMQQSIKFKIAAADGTTINLELFHTINKLPSK